MSKDDVVRVVDEMRADNSALADRFASLKGELEAVQGVRISVGVKPTKPFEEVRERK